MVRCSRSVVLGSRGRYRVICNVIACTLSVAAIGQDLDEADRLIRSGASYEAIDLLEPAVARSERQRDTAALVKSLVLLGRAHYHAGQLPAALAVLQRTIELGVPINAFSEVGKAYSLEAIIAQETSHPDTARHMYERAIRNHLLAGDTAACAIVYDNMGEFSLLQGDIPGAIRWSEKALSCLHDTTWPDHYRTAALIESSLSNYYSWLGDPAAGIEHGERSHELAQRSNELYAIVQSGTSLAYAYLANRDPHKALVLLLRSDSLVRGNAYPVNKRRDIPELLSIAYEQLGDYRKALQYYKERAVIHDSVKSNDTRRAMERMERRQIHVADSLAHDTELREGAAQHEQEIKAQQWKLWGALGGAVFIGLFTFVLWDRDRRSRHANETIIAKQGELVRSEKAREAEELRTRIARDIHDEMGSELTKITLLGKKARRQLSGAPGEAAAAVDRIRELSRKLGGTLSDIVWAVDPQRDTVQGLVDHARAVTRMLMEDAPMNAAIHFEHSGADHAIDPAVRRDIFLVLKEALNNTVKHAGATEVEVTLKSDASNYRVTVKDNGLGFDPGQMIMGNGLANIRARAARLGAHLAIVSSPGKGATVDLQGTFGP